VVSVGGSCGFGQRDENIDVCFGILMVLDLRAKRLAMMTGTAGFLRGGWLQWGTP